MDLIFYENGQIVAILDDADNHYIDDLATLFKFAEEANRTWSWKITKKEGED